MYGRNVSLTCGRSAPLFIRWNSTCLQWPLEKKVRFSSKLLDIEKHWKNNGLQCVTQPSSSNLPPKYVLAMFPYPSGRLHIGHLRVYTISDVCSRYYRLKGHDTIHPIGWDAFGLPAENAAHEHGVDAAQWTFDNIRVMREQLKQTGIHFDWDREIATCNADYYRWTQWLFLQLYERGFVRRTLAEVYWDPIDLTVLAAEQVDADGRSWRSGAVVELRRLLHWVVETPKYAKRLLDGLEALRFDWGEVADIQTNWIGRCDVYRFLLPIQDANDINRAGERFDLRVRNPLELLTARFLLITSNHSLAVEHRRHQNSTTGDDEDFYFLRERVRNPFNGVLMPIVVAPKAFVAADKQEEIGGLFVMNAKPANPTGNAFDAQIARQLGIREERLTEKHASVDKIIQDAKAASLGGYLTSRTLQDWVVSRQRAWGTPIPMLLDAKCESLALPVGYNKLPVLLKHRGTHVADQRLPSGLGILEMDTLDTFFDSSWYFLRFLDKRNANALADHRLIRERMPVDLYVGGVEHADLHLFFARFVSHFLHSELELLDNPEPFCRLIPQGIVRGRTFRLGDVYLRTDQVEEHPVGSKSYVEKASGAEVSCQFEKMSKSKHNGVDPLVLVAKDGIDLARLQLLDAAAPRQFINWGATQEADVKGMRRLLDRCASIVSTYIESRTLMDATSSPLDDSIEWYCKDQRNECTRTVSVAISVNNVHNIAIRQLQIFSSAIKKVDVKATVSSVEYEKAVHSLVIMLQPFAPHTAAELWAALSTVPNKSSPNLWRSGDPVSAQSWPLIDEDAAIDFLISIGANKLSCRERRDVVEQMTLNDAFFLAKTKYFVKFFDLLAEQDIEVENAQLKNHEGLQVTLELKLSAGKSKAVMKIFDQFVKKRRD